MTHFTIYKLIILIISLYFIFERVRKYSQNEYTQTLFKLFVSLSIWIGLIAIVLFGDWFIHFSNQELGSTESLLLLGFMIVFMLIFRLLSIIEKVERQIIEIVRADALKKIQKK